MIRDECTTTRKANAGMMTMTFKELEKRILEDDAKA